MRRTWTLFVLAVCIQGVGAQAPDFEKITATLSEFRGGAAAEISIRFSASDFKLMRQSEATITEADGQHLIANFKSLPSLEIARDGHWFLYDLNSDVDVVKPVTGTGSQVNRQWKKRTLNTVASYPRSAWPAFLQFALTNGLSAIRTLRFGGEAAYIFSFSPKTPEHFSAGRLTIELPPDFRENMRFSPRFRNHAGANGFVILLHDPHQSVSGRFQTLSSLHALATANPGVKFRFLVEGAYEDATRKIPFNGLESLVSSAGEARAALVHSWLSHFIINTPMAYRLLYDQGLYAHAIDDNSKLQYGAPPPGRGVREQRTSLAKLMKSILQSNSLSEREKNSAAETVTEAAVYMRADEREAPGDQLVSYYKKLAGRSREIADLAQRLASSGALDASDASGLRQDAARLEWEQIQFQKALERNETMAPEIVAQASSQAGDLNIAFIGNFHTSAIVPQLQSAGIGYVVIEPRPKVITSDAETEAFDKANHSDSRQRYFQSARLNMGFNGPTTREVQEYISPKTGPKVSEIRATRATFEREFRGIEGCAVVTDRMISAMDNNGALSQFIVSSGGNQPPPTDNFRKAFAFFDPGEENKFNLVISDPQDHKWADRGRYEFFRNVLLITPQDRQGVVTETLLNFFPEPNSGVLFFTVYDPKSKRIYCFEGEARSVQGFVPAPFPSNGDRDARMQLTEIIVKGKGPNG